MILSFVGKLLKSVRAGEEKLFANLVTSPAQTIQLTSPQFAAGTTMPAGHHVPVLHWSGAPQETEEFFLICEDPDAPMTAPIVHWIAYGIDAKTRNTSELTHENFGKNQMGRRAYHGPGPIPGHGPHNYIFQIFALDRKINWQKPPKKADALAAIRGHVLASGELRGIFERH